VLYRARFFNGFATRLSILPLLAATKVETWYTSFWRTAASHFDHLRCLSVWLRAYGAKS